MAICLSAQPPNPTRSQTTVFQERPETDLLLLALRVNNSTINDAFPAFALEKSVIVPLGALSAELGFGIQVDVANATADGFFISESRRFHVDVRNGSVTVEGKESTFDRRRVEVHQDDIYVDIGLLAKWFPLDISVDLYAAVLKMHSREPLPVELRRARQQQIEKTLANLGYAGAKYPTVRIPYSAFDWPFIDQQFRVSRAPAAPGQRSTSFQYSTLATGDLLGLESSLFLIGDDRKPFSEMRLTLGRRDPDAALLGPLHAREFEFGEVFYPGLDLISLPASGPGLTMSSFPLEMQSRFDQHTFIGDLPLGWDVELYRNEALIGYQTSNPQGRYDFRDVPLLFGFNRFRLAFYGPQGQRREEAQTYNVGESLLRPHQFLYRFSAVDPKALTRRSLLELAYGWSSHFTTNASLSSVPLADGEHRYGTLALRGYWSRLFVNVDGATDLHGGSVIRGGVDTRVGPVTLAISRAQLHNFESEILLPRYGQISSRTKLRLSGALETHVIPPVALLLDITTDQLANGGRAVQLSDVISTVVASTSISHRMDGFVFRGAGLPSDSVTGAVLLSRFLRSLMVRGEVDYGIRPAAELTSVAATAEKRITPEILVAGQVTRTIATGLTHFIGSISRTEGRFSFGVDVDRSSAGATLVRVVLSAGTYRDPFANAWRVQARPIAAHGAVAARVFLDTNGNDVWDPGEKPVSGAGFFVNRASQPSATDSRGNALLTNLPTDQQTDVAISPSSLEDPLWIPEKPGVRLTPRPGKVAVVDFPVLVSGEVTGTVFFRTTDKPREAPGLRVDLVRDGAIVKQTQTAYDGFFDLTNIVPGAYVLRVTSDRAGHALEGDTQKIIRIDPGGTALDGVDFVVGIRPAPVIAAHAVRGRVVVCEGGEPKALAGVTVVLFDALFSAAAMTQADGRFAFDGVPDGSYIVILSDEGGSRGLPSNLPRTVLTVQRDVDAYSITVNCPPATSQ